MLCTRKSGDWSKLLLQFRPVVAGCWLLVAGCWLDCPDVSAQECIGSARGGLPVWAVAETSVTIPIPVPVGGTLDVGPMTAGVSVAGGVQFRNGLNAMVGFHYFSLPQNQSFVEFVRHTELSLQVGYSLLSTRYVQWDVGLRLGLAFVAKRFLKPEIGEDGKLIGDPSSTTGYKGDLFQTSLVAPITGLMSRVTWFPTQWLGVFAEVGAAVAIHGDLRFKDGAFTFRPQVGLQVHF